MPTDDSPLAGLPAGSLALGSLSLGLCWWFPFGVVLGLSGVALGVAGWFGPGRPVRAILGCGLAAAGVGAGVLLGWGSWARLFGL